MSISISARLRAAAESLSEIARSQYASHVEHATVLLQETFERGGKLLVFGNGGSAADAEHLSAELLGRFLVHRKPMPAIALSSNTAFLTAWSNDHGFDDVFARQIEALGRPGDAAWGISTSGASTNVLNGVRRARELGLKTIGLTGQGGGKLAEFCDVLIAVPLTETPRIQEAHLITYHAICAALEERLFGTEGQTPRP